MKPILTLLSVIVFTFTVISADKNIRPLGSEIDSIMRGFDTPACLYFGGFFCQ